MSSGETGDLSRVNNGGASVYIIWGFLNICCTKYNSERPPVKAGLIKASAWTSCSHCMQWISAHCCFGL